MKTNQGAYMGILQEAIVDHGIDNVQIKFKGGSLVNNKMNLLCRLEKYWGTDNFNEYVHKIKVISVEPTIIQYGDTTETRYDYHNYYLSDLECDVGAGYIEVIADGFINVKL